MMFVFQARVAVAGIITGVVLAGCGGGSDDSVPDVGSDPATTPVPGSGAAPVTGGSPDSGVGVSPGALEVTPAAAADYWGYTLQMQANSRDATGAAVPAGVVAWTSSDPGVAAVDTTGLLALISPGTVSITATAGTTVSAPATITVEGFSSVLGSQSDDTCSTNEARSQIICWGKGWSITPNRPRENAFPRPTPLLMGAIPAGTLIRQVAPGFEFSCALTDAGDAYCWRGTQADDALAALGTAPGTDPNVPQQVLQGERPDGVTFTKIDLYRAAACAIGSDNEIYCWGESRALPAVANPPSPRVPIYAAPVKMNRGALAATDVITDIALSINNGCGLIESGRAFCWQQALLVGDVPTFIAAGAIPANTRLVALETDYKDFFVALGDDGWAYTWGDSPGYRAGDGSTDIVQGDPVPRRIAQGAIPAAEKIVRASSSAGDAFGANCVLTDAGSAYCWGNGLGGSLGNGNTARDQNVGVPTRVLQGELPASVRLVELACGSAHCAATGSDRKVYSWGLNDSGALGVTGAGNGIPVVISRVDKF